MIVAHELTKRFQDGENSVLAVDRLSFRVEPGEVYGLLGPNGAGKTTTLRMIIGLLFPDNGWAEVAGFRTSESPFEVRARIGLVSANDGVYPWLTVREMLLYFAELYGTPHDEALEQMEWLSEILGFREYLDRRSNALSTGQKQRVTLARGLIHRPPVLLMDEPTRGLDVVASRTVFEYIAHAREQGLAVIVCTHRLDEAQRICDRFGLVHRGQIAREGTFEQLSAETGRANLVEMFYDLMEVEPAPDQRLASPGFGVQSDGANR